MLMEIRRGYDRHTGQRWLASGVEERGNIHHKMAYGIAVGDEDGDGMKELAVGVNF